MGKRLFDLLVALFALVPIAPVVLVLAVLVRLDSPGPAFFLQSRVGRGGRRFRIVKLRTMVADAASRGPRITAADDARVTRLGCVLRRHHLDELPQLLNVIVGHMSLVGPRPELPEIVEGYSEAEREVLSVRPGLTDPATLAFLDEAELLAQAPDPTRAYVEQILPRKLRLNLAYVGRHGLLGDVRLLLATLMLLVQRAIVRAGRPGQMALDAGIVAAALIAAYAVRFEFDIPHRFWKQLVLLAPYTVLARLGANQLFRVYRVSWSHVSLYELPRFVKSVALVSATFLLFRMFYDGSNPYLRVPISVVALEGTLTLLGFLGVRFLRRWTREVTRTRLRGMRERSEKVLILGAGELARLTAREIRTHADIDMDVVGFVDDDPTKRGLEIEGAPVLGGFDLLAPLYARYRFATALLAVADLPVAQKRALAEVCERLDVRLRVVPASGAFITGKVKVSEIRELAIEDLLGRPVRDLARGDPLLAPAYGGKRVAVTGAGGSIGSELCRQLVSLAPARLILVDHDENNVFHIEGELRRRFPGLDVVPRILDVRAREKLERAFAELRPDVVLHAAAYKHVPLMELNPYEAIENNVLGTRNVAEAAVQAGAERFVLISTDKAVNPTSVMGATKRLAELSVRLLAERSPGTRFACVRFGNVLGSRGSVIPTFQEQIRRGGPVTVTHPEVTRYFMTIPEATQLVLKAGTLADRAPVFVLDMGEPVKIVDLARQMIRLSGFTEEQIPICFVGLRPGEKLYEELLIAGDDVVPTTLEKIFVSKPELRDLETFERQLARLVEHARAADADAVRSHLATMEIGFQPTPNA